MGRRRPRHGPEDGAAGADVFGIERRRQGGEQTREHTVPGRAPDAPPGRVPLQRVRAPGRNAGGGSRRGAPVRPGDQGRGRRMAPMKGRSSPAPMRRVRRGPPGFMDLRLPDDAAIFGVLSGSGTALESESIRGSVNGP